VLTLHHYATNKRYIKRYSIAHAHTLDALQIDDLVADKRHALA
jgi:hypothetical protein